jgi:hypothetical protein
VSYLRRTRGEEGQALLFVLVFLTLFGVLAGVLLSETASSFTLNKATQGESRLLYGADAGLEWGIKQLGSSAQCTPTFKPGKPTTAGVTVRGVSKITVTCQQATGAGSNTFGGYAVVTGVGYPSTRTPSKTTQVADYEGKQTCTSLSVDPVGPTKPTEGAGPTDCLHYTYPPATPSSTPTWTNAAAAYAPAPKAKLTGVSGVDASDVFAVGGKTGPGAGSSVWFFAGDQFTKVRTLATATLHAVWAADTGEVWAAGLHSAAGPPRVTHGAVLHCAGTCASTGSTWPRTTLGTAPLDGVYGVKTGTTYEVYAVGGSTAPMGAPVVWSCTSCTQSGATWVSHTLTGVPHGDLTGVYAVGTAVWAVGATGAKGIAVYCPSSCASSSTVWHSVTLPAGTPKLAAVTGAVTGSNTFLWIGGTNEVLTCTAGCASATPTWSATPIAGTALTGITAGDAAHVWAVGKKGAATGIVEACKSGCGAAGATWTTEGVPTGSPPLSAVAAEPTPPHAPGAKWNGDVWAVGTNKGGTGTFLTYSPPTLTSGTPAATVLGGPVFNAQKADLFETLRVSSYTEELPTCTTPPSIPAHLTVTGPTTCIPAGASAIPRSLKTLTEKFPSYSTGSSYVPTGPPPPKGRESTVALATIPAATRTRGCTNLTVFSPGTYSTNINFGGPGGTGTYFFENGLYYFTGGFAAFTNGGKTPDGLYVIGGTPSRGDKVTVATGSPCWTYIKNHLASLGSGTGVEWVLGAGTWMDVHTVNLELFTREGGAAWEGAQGLSIREVPPSCKTTGQATPGKGPSCLTTAQLSATRTGNKWEQSKPGIQLFQVDSHPGHLPHVFVHGGLFAPDNNIEEFTSTYAVTLGPIDCASLELSFASVHSPTLSIEAGTGTSSAALVATAYGPGNYRYTKTGTPLTRTKTGTPVATNGFKEEAIWGVTARRQSTTTPRIISWWVITSRTRTPT